MEEFEKYVRPVNRASAIALLRRPDCVSIPLFVRPKPLAWRDETADRIVDLSALGLDAIRVSTDGSMVIGALATLEQIAASDLLRSQTRGLLNQAAKQTAPPGIRSLASLGGALQDRSGPFDLALALLALDARAEIWTDETGERMLAVEELFARGEGALQRGELLAGVRFELPWQPGWSWSLQRIARTARDEAIVAAVALVKPGKDGASFQAAALAISGAGPFPQRCLLAEASLAGEGMTAERIARAAALVRENCQPQGDHRGSADYRRAMAGILARRALEAACKEATCASI
jgi:aerobic carbon-monoxide dehydrogenase medium subunit